MTRPARIVSLLPAATEIVCALGARSRLIGRSHECDFPTDVHDLPVCSAPRVTLPDAIEDVQPALAELARRGLSVFTVLDDVLRTLAPDLIVTQAQCDVCAVSLAEVEAAVGEWTGARPRIVSMEPRALRDVLADIQRIAEALGCPDAGVRLRGELRQRMRDIDAQANGLEGAPSVACIEWIEPLMAAGNWVPELVDLAGGDDVLGKPGAHSPCIDWQQVRDDDPDVIVVMPCGLDLARSVEAAARLAQLPGYDELEAVRSGQVFAVDGHQFFNRPGPRLAESLEILAEIFHPQRFDFGHHGSAWTALDVRG